MVNIQTEKIDLNVEVNKKITSLYKLNIAQTYRSKKLKSHFHRCLFVSKK